eukprot:1199762-Amorphochlora_amoeboformis.AAC.2
MISLKVIRHVIRNCHTLPTCDTALRPRRNNFSVTLDVTPRDTQFGLTVEPGHSFFHECSTGYDFIASSLAISRRCIQSHISSTFFLRNVIRSPTCVARRDLVRRQISSRAFVLHMGHGHGHGEGGHSHGPINFDDMSEEAGKKAQRITWCELINP